MDSTQPDITWQDRDKITGQPIGKALISLAVPAVLSVIFNLVYEVVDAYWIGKLNAESLAALAPAGYFIWMMRGLGMIVATGAIALVSRRTGEKNKQGLISAILNSIGSSFLFSILTMGLFFLFTHYTFQWFITQSDVRILAQEYSFVFLSGLVFVYLMMTLEYIIRGLGDSRTPMIVLGISLLLNTGLDPIFIFSLGMGLKGAAYATIISQTIGALLLGIILLKKIPLLNRSKTFSLSFHNTGFKNFFQQFYKIIKIGAPLGISEAGFHFIYLILTKIIELFGKEPLAAIAVAQRLEGLPFFIYLGFSLAVAPMVGQYLGNQQPNKAKQSVYLSLKITLFMTLAISGIFFIFAPTLIGVFSKEPLIIFHGVNYLRIIAISEFFLVFEIVLAGAFSGAGDTRPFSFIVLPLTILRIPMSYILAITLELGVIAIWVTIAVTTFLKGMILFFIFKKGKWAKKKV